MATVVVTAEEREWFERCRRAWDFRARMRRNLDPGVVDEAERSLRAALAVYYFPGMWDWDRNVVQPLVRRAYTDASGSEPDLLDAFSRWASKVDTFTPLRVETDVEANVPGSEVRYRDRVPLFVVEDDEYWVAVHRPERLPVERFLFDDRATLACWAWEQHFLVTVRGVLFTEVHSSGFRRTRVERSAVEKDGAAERLARSVAAMGAADAAPTPMWDHCVRCGFRDPCLQMLRGEDPAPLLGAYPARPPDDLEEGRLGGQSWGTGRGAAPPRF
ncbi:MAG: hypothetical protein ACYDAD_12055 [Acidimicrobiales bacterium]